MPRVRVHGFAMSLDGYVAGPDQDLDHPLGVNGPRLHEWVWSTEYGRRMMGEAGGETGIDNDMIAQRDQGVGATIMGRNMYGPIRGPWQDSDAWTGWWGDNPPFHHPGLRATHFPHPVHRNEGGAQPSTSSIPGSRPPSTERSRRPTGRTLWGGGAATVRQYLSARLVDDLHLVVVPILLGTGERLFENVGVDFNDYACVEHISSSDGHACPPQQSHGELAPLRSCRSRSGGADDMLLVCGKCVDATGRHEGVFVIDEGPDGALVGRVTRRRPHSDSPPIFRLWLRGIWQLGGDYPCGSAKTLRMRWSKRSASAARRGRRPPRGRVEGRSTGVRRRDQTLRPGVLEVDVDGPRCGVRRRLLALLVAGITLALSPAAALAIGYNLDHDHHVENVVAVRARAPGTLVTGWRWQIREGKKRVDIGEPVDHLARLLAINPNGGRFSDLLVRGTVGNGGFPASLWQCDGAHARQLWSSYAPPSGLRRAVRAVPVRRRLDEACGLRGSPVHRSAAVLHVPAAVTKKYYVSPCAACATTAIVTVRWTWNPRGGVDRYVYAGESGLPRAKSA